MPILADTEIIHPELGAIRFDDGRSIHDSAGSCCSASKWVCRPDGWDSDFEIYIPGGHDAPSNLDRAVEALGRRRQIDAEGRALSGGDTELGWIDLTSVPPSVAFPNNKHIYVLWTGSLDEDWRIQNFTQGNW